MTSTRVKFTNETAAATVMGHLYSAKRIGGWTVTKTGYARYFDTAARVWRDFIQFDASRFGV